MNANTETIIHGLGYLTPEQWKDFIRIHGKDAKALAIAVRDRYGMKDADVGIVPPMPRPSLVMRPDWTTVKENAEAYVQAREEGHEDPDNERQFVLEAVLEALYGKAIWEYLNDLDTQEE